MQDILKRKTLVCLILLFVSSACSCLLLEAYFRHAENIRLKNAFSNIYRLDDYMGYFLVPNLKDARLSIKGKEFFLLSTNSEGLRAPEYSFDKAPETIRIAILGGSFPWGAGTDEDDILSKVAERKLNGLNSGQRYEILNIGFPGGGSSFSSLNSYIYKARKYHPDIVVLVAQPEIATDTDYSNSIDFESMSLKPSFRDKNPCYIDGAGRLRTHVSGNAFWQGVCMHSAALRHVFSRISGASAGIKANDSLSALLDNDSEKNIGPILELGRMVKNDKAVLAVMIMHWMAFYKGKPTPQDVMESQLKRHGMAVCNMRPHFESRADQKSLYVSDGHWSRNGHRLAADLMIEMLSSNNMISFKHGQD